MPGLYTDGMELWDGDTSILGTDAGIPLDTDYPEGGAPQTVLASLQQLGAGGSIALTDAATIATNAALGNNFYVVLGGNRTLGNPTNLQDGRTYKWKVRQDATGNRTLAYGSKFIFPGGAPTASTGANATDLIIGTYFAITDQILAVMTKAYAA